MTLQFNPISGNFDLVGVNSISKTGSAQLQGNVTLTGGTNVTLTQTGQDITIAATGGGGTGDVTGPGSSTDNAITRFDGTTGKLIQNSTATLSDAGLLSTADVTVTNLSAASATTNGIVYVGTTGALEVDPNDLVWDDTNKRLGIYQNGSTPSASLDVHGTTTQLAIFNNVGTQSSTGGAGVIGQSDPGAAMSSGSRLGFLQFGGAYDGTHVTRNSAGINAFATETWSSTASGSQLVLQTTPNTTNTRTTALTIGQDQSSTFAGNVNVNGTLTSQTITPSSTATYTLGDSSHYYSNSYVSRYYLNSTAYIDGASAGKADVNGQLGITGANGTLTLSSATDGGDFNIASTASGTLAIYGSAGETLNLNLLDGALQTGGTTRLTNAGALTNIASLNTYSIPSSNIVGTTDTQTLTNKTLTTPKMSYISDTNGNTSMLLTASASAVNFLQVVNSAAGSPVILQPNGSDTNIGFSFRPRGTGTFTFNTSGGANIAAFSQGTSPVNYFYFTPGGTGVNPQLATVGTDTNIGLNLVSKGTGTVKANGVEVATISGTQTLTNKDLSSSTNTFPAGFVTWNNVTGTSQSAAVNKGYITNNASLVTVTLPSTAAVGQVVRVAGSGAGGWRIAQNSGQTVRFGVSATTTGATGRLDSVNRYDAVELICIVANTDWAVISSQGNITIT